MSNPLVTFFQRLLNIEPEEASAFMSGQPPTSPSALREASSLPDLEQGIYMAFVVRGLDVDWLTHNTSPEQPLQLLVTPQWVIEFQGKDDAGIRHRLVRVEDAPLSVKLTELDKILQRITAVESIAWGEVFYLDPSVQDKPDAVMEAWCNRQSVHATPSALEVFWLESMLGMWTAEAKDALVAYQQYRASGRPLSSNMDWKQLSEFMLNNTKPL
jgi:hypothetical protein